jgi:hypothetical protein
VTQRRWRLRSGVPMRKQFGSSCTGRTSVTVLRQKCLFSRSPSVYGHSSCSCLVFRTCPTPAMTTLTATESFL